jgi:hypothetical protein
MANLMQPPGRHVADAAMLIDQLKDGQGQQLQTLALDQDHSSDQLVAVLKDAMSGTGADESKLDALLSTNK